MADNPAPAEAEAGLAAQVAAFEARMAAEGRAAARAAWALAVAAFAAGRPDLAEAALAALPPGLRPEALVRRLPFPAGGASFADALARRSLLAAAHRAETGRPLPEWVVNDKRRGRALAAALGLTVPRLIRARLRPEVAEFVPGQFLKPLRGHDGAGAFRVAGPDRILDVGAREWVDAATARARLAAHAARPGNAALAWQVEEAVPGAGDGLPHDLKVYAFYGELPIAKEVRRGAEKRFNWFRRDGSRFEAGVEDGLAFDSTPPTEAEWAAAEALSLAVPAPFLRIDFLRAADGTPVFCEITPRPSNFGRLTRANDRALGAAFARAEARLAADLVAGKPFPAFAAVAAGRAP